MDERGQGLAAAGGIALLLCVGALLAALCAAPLVARQVAPRRVECPAHVDAIKTAQLAHFAEFDDYVAPLPPRPVPQRLVDGSARPWVPHPDWARLGWEPSEAVEGSYWVEPGPGDFVVHGVCPGRGGELLHYTATRTTSATLSP